ncbi:leucine--tRNA ligase [bacterium]|nr:leucine--tRNA ligase [bacterium]
MYNFKEIEERQRKKWEESGLFKTPKQPGKKFYLLEMYAYPSGDIHIGHFRNYVLGDVVWRYKKMNGYDLLHSFGWDAFGLPAEQAAIKHKASPRQWTLNNIKLSRSTLQRIGISYDWDREVITCEPDYYKWTQWFFLFLYKNGLAYKDISFVNWCPECNTVLANEQVINGKCWRCSSEVEKRELKQWFFKITDYAERLLNDIDKLENWPEPIKIMQRNWIGKSVGATVNFLQEDLKVEMPVFTTRFDTIYGVTFMAIAPEHKLMRKLMEISPNRDEIERYVKKSIMKPELERTMEEREKDGVFTGLYAINPFSGERVQIWVADYVLAAYGTGIVMAVPAHDQRDFEFAKKYDIPIKIVINPSDSTLHLDEMETAYTEYGVMVNSRDFNGLTSEEGMEKLAQYANDNGLGKASVVYKLRDWLISRQRYWGAPIPVIYCDKCGEVPVPEKDLPVLLPSEDKVDFIPRGRSPLEDVDDFVNTKCPLCGGPARRDVDTMDTYVCSSWYHFRYLSPHNDQEPFSREDADKWLPVDYYIGGAEHATSHLLYFRFFTKVLYDHGYLGVEEPAAALFNHGMVLDGTGEIMSKSKGNVVSPVNLIDEIGIDGGRIAILFFAPPGREILWSDEGTKGATRFLNRIYNLFNDLKIDNDGILDNEEANEEAIEEVYEEANEEDKELFKLMHRTIKKVTSDIDGMQFNTSIAALMEALNEISSDILEASNFKNFVARTFIKLLSPFAPYLADYLWNKLFHHQGSICESSWPKYLEKYTTFEEITIAVQINGKLRGTIEVQADIVKEEAIELAKKQENISKYLEIGTIIKEIWIPKKIINFVIR